MKDNRKYSLTAKERKARRSGGAPTVETESKTKDDRVETTRDREVAMLDSQRSSKRFTVIVGAIIAVSILLIIAGILVPVIAYLVNPYRNYKDVIARFNLSNGMILEYVIDEKSYDIAATNFIFLAENGYFDNTVFFDAQNGWVRFGGYEQQPRLATSSTEYENTRHHGQNKTYCNNFSALPTDRFRDGDASYKFGYKLYADANGEKESIVHSLGVLTYLYSDTSTEFQLSYSDSPIDQMNRRDSSGNIQTNTLKSTMVGRALDGPDGATIQNLLTIASMAAEKSNVTYGYMWTPPTPDIYINSVKVYNLDKSKWRDFDFIEYMMSSGESGKRRVNYWTGLVTD